MRLSIFTEFKRSPVLPSGTIVPLLGSFIVTPLTVHVLYIRGNCVKPLYIHYSAWYLREDWKVMTLLFVYYTYVQKCMQLIKGFICTVFLLVFILSLLYHSNFDYCGTRITPLWALHQLQFILTVCGQKWASSLFQLTTFSSLRPYEARFWMFNRLHWLQKLHTQTLKIMSTVTEKLSVHSWTDVSLWTCMEKY